MEHRKDELLSEILRRVQRNCVRMVEIERLTKELGDALSRNDQESAQLSEIREEIRLLIQSAEVREGTKLRSWLAGEDTYQPDCFEAGKIIEFSKQIALVLNRTISIDKVINQKLAGKDSYYQKTS